MSDHSIVAEIDTFLAETGMAESTFGRLAFKDWRFVADLRGDNRPNPRRLWPETEQRARAFMATYTPPDVSAAA